TFAYTGVTGGMVLITADEPGMHSSQNEQDNRNYAKFAKIPMFEPSNSQECKDMIIEAFDVSEKFDTPVLFRITTRVSHSKSVVTLGERIEKEIIPYEKKFNKYVSIPAIGRQLRHTVEERLNKLKVYTEQSPLNYFIDNGSDELVITSGMSFEFAQEALRDKVNYLKLGFTNPLPKDLILKHTVSHDKIYIIEENDPYIEEFVRILGVEVLGKNLFPYTGEMTPDVIKRCVLNHNMQVFDVEPDKVVNRPPTFCSGCPHRGFFYELGKRKNTIIAGDIGCYSLAVGEPYNSMDWLICMGASFSSGHGAQTIFNLDKDNKKRVVAILGDSTFFHTGINSLINTVYNRGNTINVILDNRITGMTGQQDNPGSGFSIEGEVTEILDIETICKAVGVKHIRKVNPNDLKAVKETLDWAFALKETSVIITDWPCVLKKKYNDDDMANYKDLWSTKDIVLEDKCTGCKICLKTGCPSLVFNKDTKKVSIDSNSCVGCDVCLQVCPFDAIVKEEVL
ncbi:MAG: thiamine pyrophosphate-dependent enzyme, partial [Candidatus Izemoplasma sp.]